MNVFYNLYKGSKMRQLKNGDTINGIYTYKGEKMTNKIMEAFAKMLESTMNPMPIHCVKCDKPTQETLCSECMAKEDEDG